MLAERISWSSHPFWNICLLAFAWALTLSTSTLLTTVGPLSATSLGASKSLAAFTVGVFLIGAALSSVPSGWIFRRFGRFTGFAIGCLCQLIGSVLGSLAMLTGEIFWLYLGCLSVGLAQGLGQFYRFSAVEITPLEFKSRAITYVLSGGVIAAFVGPTVANYTISLVSKDYIGTYLVVALFAVANFVVICLVRFPALKSAQQIQEEKSSESSSNSTRISFRDDPNPDPNQPRSTWLICTQPLFILSCTIATLAHTIMVMIMSNVSVDMVHHGYSFHNASLTLELHFVAMFGPGFFTGKLIQKHGSFFVALIGGLIFAGSSVVLAIGTELWNYIVGMILVGIAWNFSFSAGTVMLTSSYKPEEATNVQAVNDFVLFTVAGGGSLLSGAVYSAYGWLVLIYLVSGLMVVYLALFFFALKRRKEILEAEKAQMQPLLQEDEDEVIEEGHVQPPQKSPFHMPKNDSKTQLYSTQGPDTREDRTFSDFINSFGGQQPSTSTNSVTSPLLVGGPASVGGVLSTPHNNVNNNHNMVPMRTISTNDSHSYHKSRTVSIAEVLTAVDDGQDDDLRPVRSMSVI